MEENKELNNVTPVMEVYEKPKSKKGIVALAFAGIAALGAGAYFLYKKKFGKDEYIELTDENTVDNDVSDEVNDDVETKVEE